MNNKKKKLYAELRRLAAAAEAASWALADHIRAMVNAGERQRTIAAAIGVSATYVNHLAQTVAAFPSPLRRIGVSLTAHKIAAVSANATRRAMLKRTGRPYSLTAFDALEAIQAAGISKSRDATRYLCKRAVAASAPTEYAKAMKIISKSGTIIDRCYPGDCRLLIPKLPAQGVQLFNLDPPFGDYKSADGGLRLKGFAAELTEVDGDNARDALEATCDVLRLIPSRMTPQGVALLWQTATTLRAPIMAAIEEAGLEVEITIVWAKAKGQPGAFPTPWTQGAEFIHVLKLKGAELINYDESSRHQVLDPEEYPPVPMSLFGDRHPYVKPEALLELFVKKHSQPGDIVADLFGLSGSAAIASIRNGRHFVYAESNAENFAFGSGRIAAELRKGKRA